MIANQFQPKLLPNGRQHQNDFHHSERSPNASPRAVAERKIRVLWQAPDEFISPSLRFEFQRLVVEARIALRGPLKHEYLRSFGYAIAADLAIVNRLATKTVRGRIEAQRFFRDLFGITEPRKILHFRCTISQHFIQLRMKFLFRFTMFSD